MSSPASAAPTILHIGIGSFHRAHQAWYLHRVNEMSPAHERWSLVVGDIRDDLRETRDALAAQHGVYTLETVTPQGERAYETIRSITRVLPWSADQAALIDAGADHTCKIVSFTVTEGGYYLDELDRLDVAHPDLAADLQGARKTIYGTLAALLAERAARGAGPITLQSCDNLRSNGTRFRAGMREFLARRGLASSVDGRRDAAALPRATPAGAIGAPEQPDLLAWFDANVTCPCAMVDRITPRPTADVRERVRAATGADDACPVMGESFIQWVIEERFAAGRPAWERAGAELVADVHPYEEAKIRILNATHSCIAWAGTLAGYAYIHEGTQDEAIRRFARAYVTDDVLPCLTPSPLDLARYRDVVLERFGNSHILDTNQRVAADGFSKIPGFIAPTLAESIARGAKPVSTAVLPALFLRFLQRWAQHALPYAYQDGVMDEQTARAIAGAADPVAALAADRQLWGSLAGVSALERALRAGLERVDAWLASR
ncbi:mannitol dehydrogenase family protein [Burkholderia sp. TSV86]|uniref:mannitol dehydrogenase family protein n=1 Tax=Burkholderia sp. TSV86 TaxID=1385594 RepID=UPI00075DAF5C|nr:mannitol dehydrogenase family protein [Burkholderia sp. TSV86]KVE39426.1 D-arabinitol 4-dehydrogenase [Burkholderia sp. TSV86]